MSEYHLFFDIYPILLLYASLSTIVKLSDIAKIVSGPLINCDAFLIVSYVFPTLILPIFLVIYFFVELNNLHP
jgi:hypothetical protein